MADEQNIVIYNSEDGKTCVALLARDGNIWLNQNQMAELFATSKQNIGQLISKILRENELAMEATVKKYFTVASNGKQYNIYFYSLEMIIAVGYRVRGVRGTQFRQWATQHLSEYLVKGFTIDTERLKNPDGRPDYFDELLAKIRDIRASEKRFYQKIRDLFALSSDYCSDDKSTQMFFATTQNKLLFAVTNQTAAEIVSSRANADEPNMGLTSWQGSIVRRGDIVIAKNYLRENEIDTLNRLVTLFLEDAELRVKGRKDLTLDYWKSNVDRLLKFQDRPVLQGNGKITAQESERLAKEQYDLFDAKRKKYEADKADAYDLKLLEDIEKQYKQ